MELVKSVYENLGKMLRPKDLSRYAQHVNQWNLVAARARDGEFTSLSKQMEFVEEELKETLGALKEDDRVEVIDGACDLFVVSSYAALLSDKDLTPYSDIFYPERGPTVSFSPGLALDALHRGDVIFLLKQSIALLFAIDFNLDYNMTEVLKSNDSKYPYASEILSLYKGDSLDDALRLECNAIEERSAGRYNGVHPRFVQSYNISECDRVVFFDKGGKIMKPSTFVEPKIIV